MSIKLKKQLFFLNKMKYVIEDLPNYILHSEFINQWIIDYPDEDFEIQEEDEWRIK
jgi:hypothetical protein